MERPEQLAIIGGTVSSTTTTSSKQPVGQTTWVAEPTTSKDAINVATMEMTKQEAAGQVTPEQSLPGTLSEGHLSMEQGHIPKTSQDVLEQDVAPRA
jgi:hypothetical protein